MSNINCQHYGFNFPPNSLINLLKCLTFVEDKNFIIFEPLTGTKLPYDKIKSMTKHNLYIIITTHEGASHLWFDRLLDTLVKECGVLLSNIILRSGCLYNPTSPIHHVHTIVDECSDFVYKINHCDLTVPVPVTHHYVCLNRLHRWQRYFLVTELLDRRLDRYGKISYIQDANYNDPRFPMYLESNCVSWEDQRDIKNPDLTGALINIITESAYEPEPGVDRVEFHHLPGMTEKSFKCFAMQQLPVWLAPYGSVQCYRDLGFDVFDDIINHDYDMEADPVRRIKQIADQIEKLCELTEIKNLRIKLQPRFLKNINTLKSYTNHLTELPQWQQIFNQTDKY